MQLLADENQHPIVVARLRAVGLAVEWIAETSPGINDVAILGRPDIAAVILLTYDRDFGELIFSHGYPAPLSILYTRLSRAEPGHIADRLIALLEGSVTEGQMITITKDGVRMRPFPIGARNG